MPQSDYAQPAALFGLPGPTLTLQGIRKHIRERFRGDYHFFYVYALCLPNGKPFYIGKGIGDRIEAHEREALDPRNRDPKHRIIEGMKRAGFRVGYKMLGMFREEAKALDLEKRLIARYGRIEDGSGILANLTAGGEGYAEKYVSEKWQTDENGVRVLRNVAPPSEEDLVAPTFACGADSDKAEPATARRTPLVADWQGHGLTVQVFFSRDHGEAHSVRAWMSSEWRREDEPVPVTFRVFDGRRKILEDESAFFLDRLDPILCSPRPRQPSTGRMGAESRLIACILHRLADMVDEVESGMLLVCDRKLDQAVPYGFPHRGGARVQHGAILCHAAPNKAPRFDQRYGRRDFTKRLRAWVKYNSKALKAIAHRLENDPDARAP